jgi:hypothetical protein
MSQIPSVNSQKNSGMVAMPMTPDADDQPEVLFASSAILLGDSTRRLTLRSADDGYVTGGRYGRRGQQGADSALHPGNR